MRAFVPEAQALQGAGEPELGVIDVHTVVGEAAARGAHPRLAARSCSVASTVCPLRSRGRDEEGEGMRPRGGSGHMRKPKREGRV